MRRTCRPTRHRISRADTGCQRRYTILHWRHLNLLIDLRPPPAIRIEHFNYWSDLNMAFVGSMYLNYIEAGRVSPTVYPVGMIFTRISFFTRTPGRGLARLSFDSF